MFFLLFLPYSLGCQPSNGGNTIPTDQLLSIEMKLDIAPPAVWTFPKYGVAAGSSQASSRAEAREKIRADVTKMTNAILTAHNYPTTQVTCTPTVESYVQGRPVRNQCSGDGQLLVVRGTVVAECSQGPPLVVKATSPRTTTRTGNEATTESNTIPSSDVPSNIKRIRRSDTNEDNAGTTATTETPTTPAPVPLNCLFMMDWSYFGKGQSTNIGNLAKYDAQKTYINNVAHQLYNNANLKFQAVAGAYGDLNTEKYLNNIDDAYIKTYDAFNHSLSSMYWKPETYGFIDVCGTIEDINQWLPGGTQCLIFISAEDAYDFAQCTEKVDCNKYPLVFGVELNGHTGISTQTSSLTTTTDSFPQSDIDNLVNLITNSVLNRSTGTTVGSMTTGCITQSTIGSGTTSISAITSTMQSSTSGTSGVSTSTGKTNTGSSMTDTSVATGTTGSGSSTFSSTVSPGTSTNGVSPTTGSSTKSSTAQSSTVSESTSTTIGTAGAGSSTISSTVQITTGSGTSALRTSLMSETTTSEISTASSTVQSTTDSRPTTTEDSISTKSGTPRASTVEGTPGPRTTDSSTSIFSTSPGTVTSTVSPSATSSHMSSASASVSTSASQTSVSDGTPATGGITTSVPTQTEPFIVSTSATPPQDNTPSSSTPIPEGTTVTGGSTASSSPGTQTSTIPTSPTSPEANEASSSSIPETSTDSTVLTTTLPITAVTNGQVTAGAQSLWQQFAREFQEELASRNADFYKDISF